MALVTGCGSVGPGPGNGKAISALFAREGARSYGCDIRLEAAQETCAIVRDEIGEIDVMQCDVASNEQDSQATWFARALRPATRGRRMPGLIRKPAAASRLMC
ncbi:hypothetical protein BH11PSE11_BH11PSE11_10410 [soil metagenome]